MKVVLNPTKCRTDKFLIIALMVFISFPLPAQTADSTVDRTYLHAIDLCPMSPLFRIYAIHYSYRFAANSELIVGPYYANIQFEDIGHTDAPGFILGYRYYFGDNFHIDYQLMPQWDRFYDKVANKKYQTGFDLWNEFRLGYAWDFHVGGVPAYLNVQWPFGFALYSDGSAKPQSFKDKAKTEPFFYFPPLFFVGIRF